MQMTRDIKAIKTIFQVCKYVKKKRKTKETTGPLQNEEDNQVFTDRNSYCWVQLAAKIVKEKKVQSNTRTG